MENIEEKAGQTLRETGIPFDLKYTEGRKRFLWFEYGKSVEKTEHYVIRPLKMGALAAISEIACTIPEFNEKDQLLAVAMSSPENYKKVCRAVAIGILNDKIRIEEETDRLAELIRWALDVEKVLELYAGIVGSMNVQGFFFIINLIKGKNILTKDTKEENLFGGLSEQQSKSTT